MHKDSLVNEKSIDDIINEYSQMVYRLAFSQTKNRSDADDIFQEVFLRYIKCTKEFLNENHRKAWLIKVTINCSKNLWSSSWFRHRATLNEEIKFESKEEYEIYHSIIKLPLKYRRVIHLFYYEDMSISDISKTLNIRESTIRTQLTRARNILKDLLKGDFDYV